MNNENNIYKTNLIIWLILLSSIFVLSLISWFLSENESLNIIFVSFFISVFPTFCFVLSYYLLRRNIILPTDYFKIFFIITVAPVVFLTRETISYRTAIIFFLVMGIVYWVIFKTGKIPQNKEKAKIVYSKRAGKILLIFGVLLSLFVIYAFIRNLSFI